MSANGAKKDLFDAVLDWEEKQYAQGYDAGWQAGVGEATVEGVKMGAEAGSVAGMRLGYIAGYVEVVKRLQGKLDASPRARSTLSQLDALLQSVDMDNLDEDIIIKIEGKFTLLSQQLRVKPNGVSTNALLNTANAKPQPDLSF
eukprot:TRINITY_DN42462_c0_g1_i1.p1 TRINITY_DN42462_c0_g1~~TRINITY_DN42462_c0_g1_i1.p1  ORF type:complete len:161 (+),score=54.72 TRINITY_DN42462_c0_g1_i1:53-484(+)